MEVKPSIIPILPMLAKKSPMGIPKGDYKFETKWDGMRVIVRRYRNRVKLWTRRGQEVMDHFPELLIPEAFQEEGVFDGELVCFTDGKPDFRTVVGRRHNIDPTVIARRAQDDPATCMLFDCLRIGDLDIFKQPWHERRKILENEVLCPVGNEGRFYQISKTYDNGAELFEKAKKQGLEGVMAKDIHAPYYPGKRRRAWLKIKVLFTEDVLVTGFTLGQGKRKGFFGSLFITDMEGNDRGNVGTGFTDQDLFDYMVLFQANGMTLQAGDQVYKLRTPMPAEVRHMENTIHGKLREPVFMRFRTED